jgi:hypothetical protein
MPDSTDDPRKQSQSLGALVRDQDSQELALTIRIQHLRPFLVDTELRPAVAFFDLMRAGTGA